ncbi:MAG: hypothetical protein HY360_17445 [Verrucomicrobia bacterium]|nr:hypothetical protein [Verrucomicrobiota bacterium]
MNGWLRVGAVLLCLATSAVAGFKLPREVYSVDELGKARAEAKAKKKALTFLYTDSGST